MKKIIILHSIEHFIRFANLKEKFYQNPSIKILAFTIEIRLFLQNKKIPYIIPEQFLYEEEAEEIDKQAAYITENWHKDLLIYKGISFGMVLQKTLFFNFSQILRNLVIFSKIIEIEKPSEIVTIEDLNGHIRGINEVIEHVCAIKNLIFNRVSKDDPIETDLSELNQNIKQNTLLKIIGESSLYIFFMKVMLKFIWAIQDIKSIFKKKKKNILMFGKYYYHDSVVQKAFKNYNLIFLDERPNLSRELGIFHFIRDGNHKFFNFYNSKKIKKQTLKEYKIIVEKCNKIMEKPDFKDIFTFNNLSFWPIFKKVIVNNLIFIFEKYIKTFLISYKILIEKKYDLLVFGQDFRPAARFLSYLSSKMKIPSLVIQHGITGHYLSFIPTYCTKIAVWGKISRDYLIKHGPTNDKFDITGTPRFDEYININNSKQSHINIIKNSVYKHFKIKKDKKLIVFASTFNHFYKYTSRDINHIENEKMLRMVFKATKNLPDSHLILKLHSGDFHGHLPLELKNILRVKNMSITRDYKIIDLIVACDCFITNFSTTIIEAMLVEKPIIIINFRKSQEVIPIRKYNIVDIVSNYEDLIKLIKDMLNESKSTNEYETFLKDYIYKTDGLSTKRVINLMNGLMSNNK